VTAAGQDGEGLVTEEMVNRLFDAASHWDEEERFDRIQVALAAVAPDIAEAARRECAEELLAAVRVARLRHRNGKTAGMMLAPFEFLADSWKAEAPPATTP
jgi:hypothetical protein